MKVADRGACAGVSVHCIELVELSGEANFHQLLDREPLFFMGGVLLGSVPVAMEAPGLVGVRVAAVVAVIG